MEELKFKSGCLVCGKDLVYSNEPEDLTCYYCGKSFPALVACPEGHYVCDKCHSSGVMDLIELFCTQTDLCEPVRIADILMKNPNFRMHGPEHHFLVPAALLASYYNILDKPALKKKKIRYARARAEYVPGGVCGSHGSCGAGIGTGIFISLITEATSLSKTEWRQSNLMTSQSLENIALHGGPRCCKRNTFLAISSAALFVKKHFNTDIKVPEKILCTFDAYNKECLKEECPFNRSNFLYGEG